MVRGEISYDRVTLVPELGAAGDVTEQEDSLAVGPGVGEGTCIGLTQEIWNFEQRCSVKIVFVMEYKINQSKKRLEGCQLKGC